MPVKPESRFAPGRTRDIVCLGRLAVDLYAQQIGARLEDVSSFAKYLGGSSANIAFGCARLGLKSAMLARVGNDHMGRFLTETLEREGCDVSHVRVDRERLTALGAARPEGPRHVPARCSIARTARTWPSTKPTSMKRIIASSKALLITGTHFSTEQVNRTSRRALDYARRNEVRTVLDIDYRPVLWGLTGQGRWRDALHRERRRDRALAAHPAAVRPRDRHRGGVPHRGRQGPIDRCARGGARGDDARRWWSSAARSAARSSTARCPLRSTMRRSRRRRSRSAERARRGRCVRVRLSLRLAARRTDSKPAPHANACGALVVSRHGCAPAMPTPAELDYFLRRSEEDPARMRRPDRDATLARLHRVTPAPQAMGRSVRLRIRSSQPVLRSRAANRRRRSTHRRRSRACSSKPSRRRSSSLASPAASAF